MKFVVKNQPQISAIIYVFFLHLFNPIKKTLSPIFIIWLL